MATTPVQVLLGAVRRRLWWGECVVAARLALWGTAASILAAVALHLAAGPVPVGALLSLVAVLWTVMLARAAWRRPSDSACALWADRQLGGASAFTTLREMEQGRPAAADSQAVQWLEAWAAARVPSGLRLLAERPLPVRLSRPLLSVLVSAALASLVLTLPDLAPVARPQAAAPPASSAVDRPLLTAETPASAHALSDIASALRSAASRETPERRAEGTGPAAGRGQPEDGPPTPTASAGTRPAGEAETDTGAAATTAGTTARTAPATGTTATAGKGSGREAGDSRADRVDGGSSPVARGTMSVQRSASRVRDTSSGMQADTERTAEYDDAVPSGRAAALRALPTPAAATPPAAVEFARLAPTEATYVQAWMTASAGSR